MENKSISEAMTNRINLRNREAANEAIRGLPQRSPGAILEEIASRLGAPTPPATAPKPYVNPPGFIEAMKEAVKQRVASRGEEPDIEAIKGLTYESDK